MKKNKVTKEQWVKAVRTARQYTQSYGKVRFIIAGLALEVCDYSQTGRKSETIFSVSKFAEEIELDRKTLYQWIRVKRLVLDKLPKGTQDKPNKHLYQDYSQASDLVKEDTPAAEVRRVFSEVLNQNPESKKFSKYIRHLSAIFYNVSRPMIMKDVEKKHIDTMIEKTKIIHNLLLKELELREKYKDGPRADAKRLNLKKEIADRLIEAE